MHEDFVPRPTHARSPESPGNPMQAPRRNSPGTSSEMSPSRARSCTCSRPARHASIRASRSRTAWNHTSRPIASASLPARREVPGVDVPVDPSVPGAVHVRVGEALEVPRQATTSLIRIDCEIGDEDHGYADELQGVHHIGGHRGELCRDVLRGRDEAPARPVHRHAPASPDTPRARLQVSLRRKAASPNRLAAIGVPRIAWVGFEPTTSGS